MKKITTIFIVLFCITSAQAQLLKQGDFVANIGVNPLDYLKRKSSFEMVVPVTNLILEYGIVEDVFSEKSSIGVGFYAGYGLKEDIRPYSLGSSGYKYHYTILGLRAALHYEFIEHFDTYAGVMAGYTFGTPVYYGNPLLSSTVEKYSVGGVALSVFAGGRYYFTKNIGVFVEGGFGINVAAIQAGLSVKF